MIEVTPVILCGGSGSRLWPMSRAGFPKQFLCLNGENSLFQEAVIRMKNLDTSEIKVSKPLIVTGEDHRFLVTEQLREIGIEFQFALLEPCSKNTAPALTMAAFEAIKENQETVLIVIPADQMIDDVDVFAATIQRGVLEAEKGSIITLGITPTAPETGYGYIKAIKETTSLEIFNIKHFKEKPDLQTANIYLKNNDYYWNSGVYILKASVWIQAIKKFNLELHDGVFKAWEKKSHEIKFIRPNKEEFLKISAESIDCAVIEYCPAGNIPIKMIRLDTGWSDLGTWESVWKSLPKDISGNAFKGDVIILDSKNTLVQATSRLVSLLGVEDLIVIETADAVLVTNRKNNQNLKKIVEVLAVEERDEQAQHRKVLRPWGWYDNIDHGARFKVKRILVNPGASISLQMHYHRSEHWVVVSGVAEIIKGNETVLLNENQSIYIAAEEVHRLTNPGEFPLEIIEVQSGVYLGEDDIVRISDKYGRAQ